MAERVPIGEALNGLTVFPLDPGIVAIECVILIKAMDEDGDSAWLMRTTESISAVEVLGSLDVMITRQRNAFDGNWRSDDDEV